MSRIIWFVGVLVFVFLRVEAGVRVQRSPQYGYSEANAQARSFGGYDPYYRHHHHHHGGYEGGPGYGGYGGGYGPGNGGFGGRGYGGYGGPGFGYGGGPGYGQPGESISISKSVSINAGPGRSAAQSSANSGSYGKR